MSEERQDAHKQHRIVFDLINAERHYTGASGTLATEIQARLTARELAKQIGDEEWRQGNTKYAFEAYEAACVPPSEILAKAEALLEAEKIMKEWEVENGKASALRRASGCPAQSYNQVGVYCTAEDCTHCRTREHVNNGYVNRLYNVLGWDKSRITEKDQNLHTIHDPTVVRFYDTSAKGSKYRAAAVAALKLVSRLERFYITTKTPHPNS